MLRLSLSLANICAYADICGCKYFYLCIYMYICIHTRVSVIVSLYIHKYLHVCICYCISPYYIHTYMCVYVNGLNYSVCLGIRGGFYSYSMLSFNVWFWETLTKIFLAPGPLFYFICNFVTFTTRNYHRRLA